MRAGVVVARSREDGERLADLLDLTGWQIITPGQSIKGCRCKPVVITTDPDLLTPDVVAAVAGMAYPASQPLTFYTLLLTLPTPAAPAPRAPEVCGHCGQQLGGTCPGCHRRQHDHTKKKCYLC
ncbi:hypothetical protein [Mycobacteroides abscessus]|uniref:hypothetical protein n=1 Tax=Mycobacteroides abscessus TaxID=36809 RepID=UPI0009278330|nr:hypothetical protein [Mycobacteroides abscessus]PVB16398.1 hypothetical protein DDJ71_19630 [Mycobacteroides abscessus]SIK47637.1 Uncharacterised protein [Mycobacteroides abscessus subsp. abscessus]